VWGGRGGKLIKWKWGLLQRGKNNNSKKNLSGGVKGVRKKKLRCIIQGEKEIRERKGKGKRISSLWLGKTNKQKLQLLREKKK